MLRYLTKMNTNVTVELFDALVKEFWQSKMTIEHKVTVAGSW